MISPAKRDAAMKAMRRSALLMSKVAPGMLPVYLSLKLVPTDDPEVSLRVGVDCGSSVMEFNVDFAMLLEPSLLGSVIYMGCLQVGLHHCDKRKQEPVQLLKLASTLVVAEYAKKVVDISAGRNLEILNQLFPSYMTYWSVLKKHDFHPEVDLTLEKLFKIFKEEYADMKKQMPEESEEEKKENPGNNRDESKDGKKQSESNQGQDGKGSPSKKQESEGSEEQGGHGSQGDSKETSPDNPGQQGTDGKGQDDSTEGKSGQEGKDGEGDSGGKGESEGSKDGEGESDTDGNPGSPDSSQDGDSDGNPGEDSSGKSDSQGGEGQPDGDDNRQDSQPQDKGQDESGMGGDGSSGEGADGGSQAGNNSGDGAGGDGEGDGGDDTDGEGSQAGDTGGAPDSGAQGSGSGSPSMPMDDFSRMSRFFSLTNASSSKDLEKWDQDEVAHDATSAKVMESLDKGLFEKARSNLPVMLRNASRVKVDTAAMFKHFMRNVQDDEPVSTWSRRNRKYLKYGMIAPGYIYDEIPKVLFCIDVSGSMYQGNALANCLTVMENALDGVSIDIVYWDAVCSPVFSTLKTLTEMAIYGGGHTNPDCVLQKLGPERFKYDGLVFVTDCLFEWPEPPKSKQIMILRTHGKEPFPDWCRYTDELETFVGN